MKKKGTGTRLSTELPPKEKSLDEILSSHISYDRDTTIASHDYVTMKACHGHSLHEVVLDQWLWPILTNEILCDVLIFHRPMSV